MNINRWLVMAGIAAVMGLGANQVVAQPNGGGGGGGAQPADQQGQQRRGGFGGTPNPDAEALQKAIDSKGSKAEIKTALDKYVASRKAKQAALEQSQADLRKILTSRQEAIATLNGLL
jgi:hypothetical protein